MHIMMISLMNGKERDLDEWKALFEQVDSHFEWNGEMRPDGCKLWTIKAAWKPRGVQAHTCFDYMEI